MDAQSLVQVINRDAAFFGDDGGVTISGGEPFAQPEFLFSVLKMCHESGISSAVESALNIPWKNIERSLPFIDFFIFDLKIMDPDLHQKFCGTKNNQILKNISKLAKDAKTQLLPRVPMIPGITDTYSNIEAIAVFLKQNGINYLQLIPYMKLGNIKYEQIGKNYRLKSLDSVSPDHLKEIKNIFNKLGITCK